MLTILVRGSPCLVSLHSEVLVNLLKNIICISCPTRVMIMSKADQILEGVGHVILVLSGKGGVGKSTVTTQLALSLVQAGKTVKRILKEYTNHSVTFLLKVGILDIDLCGPSIPRMFHLESHDVHQCSDG